MVDVLVEDDEPVGRAAHQGPETDGDRPRLSGAGRAGGRFVPAVVVDTDGVDLVADVRGPPW